jgi:Arc/MetJ family transcription regulator
MRTSIDVDEELMKAVLAATGHATEREAVEEALRTLLRIKRQEKILAAGGTFPDLVDVRQRRKRIS